VKPVRVWPLAESHGIIHHHHQYHHHHVVVVDRDMPHRNGDVVKVFEDSDLRGDLKKPVVSAPVGVVVAARDELLDVVSSGSSPLSTTPLSYPSYDPAIMTSLSEFRTYTEGLRVKNFDEREVERPKKIYRVVLTGGMSY